MAGAPLFPRAGWMRASAAWALVAVWQATLVLADDSGEVPDPHDDENQRNSIFLAGIAVVTMMAFFLFVGCLLPPPLIQY